ARLSRARGTRETLAILTSELRDGVGAETLRILHLERTGFFADQSCDDKALGFDGALAALLRESIEPLDVSADSVLLALLPHQDRDWVATIGGHLVAPLRRRDGEMAAVVVLGPKTLGIPFDRRDRWLIVTLLAAAGAVIDEDRATAASETTGAGTI